MLTRCPRCGDVFARDKYEICPTCRARENEHIDILRRYAESQPDASLEDLERASGMPKEIILSYVREGRLLAVDAKVLKIRCEECGVEIPNGRFCSPCRKMLASKLSAEAQTIRHHHKKV